MRIFLTLSCVTLLAACQWSNHRASSRTPVQGPQQSGPLLAEEPQLVEAASAGIETDADPVSAVAQPHAVVDAKASQSRGERPETPSPAAPATEDRQGVSTQLTAEDLALLATPGAREQYRQSLILETDLEPAVLEEELELLDQARGLLGDAQVAEMVALLEGGLRPDSSAAYDFTLGVGYQQLGRLDAAIPMFELAVQKHPKFLRGWIKLAQIHYGRSEVPQAIAAFTKVIGLGRVDPVTYGLLGVCHSRQGDSLNAETAFRMAAMLEPENTDWKGGLAECLLNQQRYPEAIVLFDALLEGDPENFKYWRVQAQAFALLGKPMEAAKKYEILDELGGSSADTLYNLGDLYTNEGVYDVAVGAYLRALDQFPDAPLERAIRAAQFMTVRGETGAAGELLAGIEKTHEDGLSESQRRNVLRLQARIAGVENAGAEEARILEEIVQLDGLDGEALIQLGTYHKVSGDPVKAIMFFERAANVEGFEAKAKVAHAQVLVAKQDYAPAIQLLKRAQDLEPTSAVQDYLDRVEQAARAR